jgi:hypothetical protein
MTTTAEKAIQLLKDLAEDNPAPTELVFGRHFFDPMHGLTELRYAGKRGLIQIVQSGSSPDTFRFTLTDAGRACAAQWDGEEVPEGLSDKLRRVRELVVELAFENPIPTEAWILASNFDPLHGKSEIGYASARGWIETKDETPNGVHLRLTTEGRKRLSA